MVDWARGRVGGQVVEDHRRTVAELIGLLLTPIAPGASSVLDLYVTHDFVVATLVAAVWPLQDDSVPWPGFLEGVLLRRENESVRLWYAGREAELPLPGLG